MSDMHINMGGINKKGNIDPACKSDDRMNEHRTDTMVSHVSRGIFSHAWQGKHGM